MSIEVILFDLDGTLSDPRLGIFQSVEYALVRMNIPVKSTDELVEFIGPPIRHSFQKIYGLDQEKTELAVKYYRSFYTEKGAFQNQLYPGIPELIQRLHSQNKILAIATTKPTVNAISILKYFDLYQYFSCVSGSELDGSRSDKGEVIRYALSCLGTDNRAQVMMIGDRSYDIAGARECGIDSIGVLYGFGSREELTKAGAGVMAKSVAHLTELLCGIE